MCVYCCMLFELKEDCHSQSVELEKYQDHPSVKQDRYVHAEVIQYITTLQTLTRFLAAKDQIKELKQILFEASLVMRDVKECLKSA